MADPLRLSDDEPDIDELLRLLPENELPRGDELLRLLPENELLLRGDELLRLLPENELPRDEELLFDEPEYELPRDEDEELWLLPPPRELDDELWPPPCEPPPRPWAYAGVTLSRAPSAKIAINLLVFIMYPFFLLLIIRFFHNAKVLTPTQVKPERPSYFSLFFGKNPNNGLKHNEKRVRICCFLTYNQRVEKISLDLSKGHNNICNPKKNFFLTTTPNG